MQRRLLVADILHKERSIYVSGVLGIGTVSALLLWMLQRWVGDPSSVIRNYDNPFHYSVVRHILETGNASPIGAGSVMGSESSIYPDLWHALVALCIQLFGVDIQVGAWIVTMLALTLFAPFGMFVLATVLFPGISKIGYYLAAAASSLGPLSILYFLVFGSLFANMLGLVLVPLALGVLVAAWRDEEPRKYAHFGVCALVCTWVMGLAHPSTVFFLALFVFAYIVCSDASLKFKALFVVSFIGVWVLLMKSPLFYRTVNCLDRVSNSEQLGAQLFGLIGLDYSAIASSSILIFLLAAAIAFLLIVLALRLKNKWASSWYLAGIGLVAAVFVCACFAGSSAGKYASGFWYRDVPRLQTSLAFFMTVFVALIPSFAVWVSRGSSRVSSKGAAPLAVCVLVAVAFVPFIGVENYFGKSLHGLTSPSDAEEGGGVLSASQDSFLSDVADIVGDSVVLNGNQDGSVWLYSLYGCNALQKGCAANRMGAMGDDMRTVVCSIGLYGEDGADGARVREAVANLGVEYVVQMSAFTMASDIGESGTVEFWIVGDEGRLDASTPGFELVLERDGMTLYRLVPAEV